MDKPVEDEEKEKKVRSPPPPKVVEEAKPPVSSFNIFLTASYSSRGPLNIMAMYHVSPWTLLQACFTQKFASMAQLILYLRNLEKNILNFKNLQNFLIFQDFAVSNKYAFLNEDDEVGSGKDESD